MKRIFVVGCPRSGTTLLRSFLGAHPDVHSFPETQLFAAVLGRSAIRHFLTDEHSVQRKFFAFLQLVRPTSRAAFCFSLLYRRRAFVARMVNVMDEIASRNGKALWIEKTPAHLHFIREIERTVPEPLFVHIVRNGPDVVASMVERTRKRPQWGGARTPLESADRWNHDVAITAEYAGRPGHLVIRYETLVRSPERSMHSVCAFMGLPFDPTMLKRSSVPSDLKVPTTGDGNVNLNDPVEDRNSRKITTMFDANERDAIVHRLRSFDLHAIEDIHLRTMKAGDVTT